MNFADALRSAGLHPRDIVADGRIRRCATETHPHRRNGWHVLHPDGRGVWGDNAVAPRQALGHWRDAATTFTPPDPAALERLRQQRQRERVRQVACVREARAFWAASRPMRGVHPYLAAKGLSAQGCTALRVNGELLVVPIWRGEWLASVQTIAPDGTKLFWPGAPVKGGALVLPKPRSALTAIVEGLATGLAVLQSCRPASVIVAFDTGNLIPVVTRLKPTGSVVMAGDNDHKTMAKRGFNPGLDAGRNVADLIGCGFAAPTDIENSDWADALKEWGEGGARRIERQLLAAAKYVMGAAPML